MYHGDIRLGDTIDIKFTTRQISGAPSTLSSSPVISAYPGNSTTQLTAGITLSVDFDSVTGLNNCRVVATSGNGYLTATNYTLVITTGTVNSVSVVGECIGSFSIENRSALMPSVVARTLAVGSAGQADANVTQTGGTNVVAAGGYMAPDWAQVGNPTTTVNLSNTTIKTTQKVDVDTIKTNPVVNGGTLTFPTNATVASTTNITAGTITTVTNLTNAPTAGDLTATMKTSVQTAADAAVTANTLVNTIAGYIDTEVAAIKAKTDSLTFTVAGKVDANELAIAGSTTAATNVKNGALGIVVSTAAAGSTTTSIVTNLTEATDDHYNGRVITFTSGALLGQSSSISDYTGSTKTLLVVALTEAPADTDGFVIT